MSIEQEVIEPHLLEKYCRKVRAASPHFGAGIHQQAAAYQHYGYRMWLRAAAANRHADTAELKLKQIADLMSRQV